jgi:hypothetical protein
VEINRLGNSKSLNCIWEHSGSICNESVGQNHTTLA